MRIDIKDFDGEGYAPLVAYNGWRVAMVNYCERLREENIVRVERHLKTDEIFILLSGEATLHIGKELKRYPLALGKIYNVKCGEWHCITMKPGAKVAIVENDDTSDANSEKYYFKEDEL